MTNLSKATQPEDRCTNLNAATTLMFCLHSKTTSCGGGGGWGDQQQEKQLITYKTPNQ